jgi:YggT family protein
MIGLVHIIDILFQVYTLLLFVRILSSWVPELSKYHVMQFIYYYTDPYLNVFRKIVPPLGMFDLSPIVAFLCLSFIKNIVIRLLLFFT